MNDLQISFKVYLLGRAGKRFIILEIMVNYAYDFRSRLHQNQYSIDICTLSDNYLQTPKSLGTGVTRVKILRCQ